MKPFTLLDQVIGVLGDLAERHGFEIDVDGDAVGAGAGAGAGYAVVTLDNDMFTISVTRDRGEEAVYVLCKVRPRPRAHLRRYHVGALAAFIRRERDPYPLRDFYADAADLLRHEGRILTPKLLNSEELRRWRVEASRRQFGQKPRRSK